MVISKRTTEFKRNMGVAFSGGLMGAFLAAFLPFWIVFILLIAIALFDIYSVKYGPIKKILDLENENRKNKVRKQTIYRKLEKNPNNNANTSTQNVSDKAIAEPKQVNNDDSPANHGSPAKTIATKSTSEDDPHHGTKPPSSVTIQQQKNISELEVADKISKLKAAKQTKSKKSDDEFDLILMYDTPDWSLGLGDFVIYSMFSSAVLTYCMLYLPYYIFYSPTLGLVLPWVVFIICKVGLLIGFRITINQLKKKEYTPGVPITVACGFGVFILTILVLQIINFLMYNEFAIIF